MKSLYLFIFCLFVSVNTFSQKAKNDTLPLSKQFEQVYSRSSSYKDFKVIRKTTFQDLKENTLNSIKSIDEKLKIESLKNTRLEQEINNITKTHLELDLKLSNAILEKNTISFIGLKLKKNTFKIIIWSIFFMLIILICYLAYKLKDGIKITSQAKKELTRVEEEFNSYKKKSLVRDQKLRRQLQDEINKQRGI
ncbi:hypothetical protein N9W35_04880 [Flavobacteriaceae bacterium]|nr:hypothetical protein [Flavobacteriaceae bacterium]